MKGTIAATRSFYDDYWPRNVPDFQRTRDHIFSVIPEKAFDRALDAGCGTGVCALAMAERADLVTALDISAGSLRTAQELARQLGRVNVVHRQGDLLNLPFADGSFDLIYSWGAVDHTADPLQAIAELVRTLRPDGTLVLAVYLKTWLTPLHELSRAIALRLPPPLRSALIKSTAVFIRVLERFRSLTNVRDDNPRVESQVEDWFFVPEKHFFTIAEMGELFRRHGLTYEVLCERTGRFKSSSDFIVRGTRPQATGSVDSHAG